MAKHEMINYTEEFQKANRTDLLAPGWTLKQVWYSSPSPVWAMYRAITPAGDEVLRVDRAGKKLFQVFPNRHSDTRSMFTLDADWKKYSMAPEYVKQKFRDAVQFPELKA